MLIESLRLGVPDCAGLPGVETMRPTKLRERVVAGYSPDPSLITHGPITSRSPRSVARTASSSPGDTRGGNLGPDYGHEPRWLWR